MKNTLPLIAEDPEIILPWLARGVGGLGQYPPGLQKWLGDIHQAMVGTWGGQLLPLAGITLQPPAEPCQPASATAAQRWQWAGSGPVTCFTLAGHSRLFLAVLCIPKAAEGMQGHLKALFVSKGKTEYPSELL